MCSSIKQNGRKLHINARKAVLGFRGNNGIVEAMWKGYARLESLKSRWSGHGILVRIPATSYEERGHTFKVPPGKEMVGFVLTEKRFDRPKGAILLVTRPAETTEESAVHSRHPLLINAA